MTNQHDSSWGALCCGVQHICVVAFLHLDVLQPGDHELMILSIVPQSGVNYIITNIPDENSISALQPWSQFWSPPFQGRRAWPRRGSTAPPWTSKWSMSWHRSQTWLLGLRISRVKKYWIFAFVGRIPDVSAKHSSCNCCKTSSHHCVDLRPEDENLLI